VLKLLERLNAELEANWVAAIMKELSEGAATFQRLPNALNALVEGLCLSLLHDQTVSECLQVSIQPCTH
jgi:hypothetical protein